MEAYFKSRRDFRTFLQATVTDYGLIIDSLSPEQSSMELASASIPISAVGSWLVFDGGLYIVGQITPSNGKTRLALLPPDSMFNREMPYDGSTAATVGAFIGCQINRHWVNQSDPEFRTDYISVVNADTTPFFAPEVEDAKTYNLFDYIRSAKEQYGVCLDIGIKSNGLSVTIKKRQKRTHYLVLNDGHTKLHTSSVSSTSISKITALQPVDTGRVDDNGDKIFRQTSTDWYLSSDGHISKTPPDNRASGEWVTLSLSEGDDQEVAVTEEFSTNSENHKIEFFSDQKIRVNDLFKVNLDGMIFDGKISSAYKKLGDSRTLYKSGDLITTLTERVRAVAGNAKTVNSRAYSIGDVYQTTRVGNPSTLLGYGAWVLISSSDVGGHTVFMWLRKE